MASTSVSSGIPRLLCGDFPALLCKGCWQGGIEVVEHRLRRLGREAQVFLHRLLYLCFALRLEPRLFLFAPAPGTDQIGAQTGDRVMLPLGPDLFLSTIPAGVIRR